MSNKRYREYKRQLRKDQKCVRCGSEDDITLDHVIPKSLGGTLRPHNRQFLCKRCNCKKGSDPVDYRTSTYIIMPFMIKHPESVRNVDKFLAKNPQYKVTNAYYKETSRISNTDQLQSGET